MDVRTALFIAEAPLLVLQTLDYLFRVNAKPGRFALAAGAPYGAARGYAIKEVTMAKLVFGMNQFLDSSLDHMAFGPPSSILFRLFACIRISLVGFWSPVVMAQDIEPITTAYVTMRYLWQGDDENDCFS